MRSNLVRRKERCPQDAGVVDQTLGMLDDVMDDETSIVRSMDQDHPESSSREQTPVVNDEVEQPVSHTSQATLRSSSPGPLERNSQSLLSLAPVTPSRQSTSRTNYLPTPESLARPPRRTQSRSFIEDVPSEGFDALPVEPVSPTLQTQYITPAMYKKACVDRDTYQSQLVTSQLESNRLRQELELQQQRRETEIIQVRNFAMLFGRQ